MKETASSAFQAEERRKARSKKQESSRGAKGEGGNLRVRLYSGKKKPVGVLMGGKQAWGNLQRNKGARRRTLREGRLREGMRNGSSFTRKETREEGMEKGSNPLGGGRAEYRRWR